MGGVFGRMNTAKKLAEKIYLQGKWSGTNQGTQTWSVSWIESVIDEFLKDDHAPWCVRTEDAELMEQEAVLAERERCAKIAEDYSGLERQRQIPSAIARAIRSEATTQHTSHRAIRQPREGSK